MNNPRLAIRYAKSLLDIAEEKGIVEDVHRDMKYLKSICKSNNDFVALLRSPVIKEDKKNQIIDAITGGRINNVTTMFIRLLSAKGRESNLPEIIGSFIEQYNVKNGIHNATLITAAPISEELKEQFIQKIKASANIQNVVLETRVDENIIGGFVLQMEGKLIDSSILRDLKDVQKQFMNNDYVMQLR